jgi:hypothetical protein
VLVDSIQLLCASHKLKKLDNLLYFPLAPTWDAVPVVK